MQLANLYLDAWTFLRSAFWSVAESRRTSPWDSLRAMRTKVAEFVHAATVSRYLVVAVIEANDVTFKTEEWRRLRIGELEDGDRDLVLDLDVLLCDALRDCGIDVLRPSVDAAEALAALAVVNKGAVLSRDLGVSRYHGVRLYTEFEIDRGRLRLVRHFAESSEDADRSLSDLAPAWREASVRDKYEHAIVYQGVSSSSDRECGNLHAQSRPLRQAVYALLGDRHGVREVTPEWHGGRAIWTETVVPVDDESAPLLEEQGAILDALLIGDDLHKLRGWRLRERLFNLTVLAAELHVALHRGNLTAALFDLEDLSREALRRLEAGHVLRFDPAIPGRCKSRKPGRQSTKLNAVQRPAGQRRRQRKRRGCATGLS